MEREFGGFQEVKQKCESYDNLIRGIAEEEEYSDYADMIDALIRNGELAREKENEKKYTKNK